MERRDEIAEARPDYIFIAAAKVGGIQANNAIAKITGIKLAESYTHQHGRQYVSMMPTNLYGPNDNYDLATSHVLPALMHKAHIAKQRGDAELVVWGSGTPRRKSWRKRAISTRTHCSTSTRRAKSWRSRWSTPPRVQSSAASHLIA